MYIYRPVRAAGCGFVTPNLLYEQCIIIQLSSIKLEEVFGIMIVDIDYIFIFISICGSNVHYNCVCEKKLQYNNILFMYYYIIFIIIIIKPRAALINNILCDWKIE